MNTNNQEDILTFFLSLNNSPTNDNIRKISNYLNDLCDWIPKNSKHVKESYIGRIFVVLKKLIKDGKLYPNDTDNKNIQTLFKHLNTFTPSGKSLASGLNLLLTLQDEGIDIDTNDLNLVSTMTSTLLSTPQLPSDAFSIGLYAIALLKIPENQVLDLVKISSIEATFERLIYSSQSTRETISVLHTIRLLAENRRLSGQISSTLLEKILERLGDKKIISDATKFVFGLTDISKLAQLNHISRPISCSSINSSLKNRIHELSCEDTTQCLYTLGELAESNKLKQGLILDVDMQKAVIKKLTKWPNQENKIYNLLYAINLLAQHQHLDLNNERNFSELLNTLIEKLAKLPLTQPEKCLSNSLFQLNNIAHNSLVKFKLNTLSIENILHRFTEISVNVENMEKILLSLFNLIDKAILTKKILSRSIENLLRKLCEISTQPSVIAVCLYRYAIIAREERLASPFNHDVIHALIEKLTPSVELDAHTLSHSLYGTGLLTQMQNFSSNSATLKNIAADAANISYDQNDMTHYSMAMQGKVYLGFELSESEIELLKKNKPSENESQRSLAMQLQKEYPAAEVRSEELIGASFVDLYFKLDDKKYVIELDGEQHYISNGLLCRKDEVRDNWLRSKGYIIERYENKYTEQQILQMFSEKINRLNSDSSPQNKRKRENNSEQNNKVNTNATRYGNLFKRACVKITPPEVLQLKNTDGDNHRIQRNK